MSPSVKASVQRAPRARLIALVVAVLALIATMLSPSVSEAKGAGPGGPTGVSASLATDQSGLDGGAVPGVLAQAGVTPITLTLTLMGGTFNQTATFNLGASLSAGGRASGSVTPGQVVLAAGQSSATYTITYSAVDNGVVVTPTLTGSLAKRYSLTPGASAPFDSVKNLTFTSVGSGISTVIGGDTCVADSPEVECGIITLPNGTASTRAATTLGSCIGIVGCPSAGNGTPQPQVVGFIAGLGTLYTKDAPAQITIRCDKSRCGKGGVNAYTVKMSFAATGPLDIVSQPCIAKGIADDGLGNDFCTDYRATTRDNSGDLLIAVNVVRDYRGAV